MDRSRLQSVSLISILAIFGSQSQGYAQVQVSPTPRCEACRIEYTLVTTLTGERVAGEPKAIVRSDRGHYFVSFFRPADQVLEFDAQGQFVRVVAGSGQGPGEVTRVADLQLHADSLVIYEQDRLQVLAPTGEFVRSQRLPLPMVHRALPLTAALHVVNIGAFTPGTLGVPIHLLDGEEVEKSFGADPSAPTDPVTPYLMVRALSRAPGGRFWTAPLTRYRVDEWDREGQPTRSWSIRAPWFAPWDELIPVSRSQAPSPRLVSIAPTAGGRMLLLLAVPHDQWREYLGKPVQGSSGESYPEADFTRIFRPHLAVLDPSGGFLLTTSEELPSGSLLMPGGLVAGYREDQLGIPSIEIWQIRVQQP